MRKVLPILLLLIGVGSGVGAGLAFRPEPALSTSLAENPCGEMEVETHEHHGSDDMGSASEKEYVKLNNQFIVPVVNDNRVEALVVLSLSLEVVRGRREEVYSREPRLRDAFLQVLFDHANMGGFRGVFTNSSNMDALRRALQEKADKVAENLIRDVLIIDINRQDI